MRTTRQRSDIQYRMAEIRASEDGGGFAGYASHFWSVDSYGTALKQGAFRKTLKDRGDRIPVLWQHNPDWPIGKPNELREDKTGLRFNASISEATTYGRDAMALLRDDVPLGMSFGFQSVRTRPGTSDDPIDFAGIKAKPDEIEVIEEVRLWEISLVTFPANENASINDIRAVAEADALNSLIERIRNGDLSEDQAVLVAELVAAHNARATPEPDLTADTTPPDAADSARRRNIALDIDIAIARFAELTGVTA